MTPGGAAFSFPADARTHPDAEAKTLDDLTPPPEPAAPRPTRVPWHALPPEAKAAINRRSWYRAVILFLLTVYTTLLVGVGLRSAITDAPLHLPDGWIYSLPLLVILLCHEFGHYLLARRHGVAVTPPHFIPVPEFLGTFGAVIAFRSPLHNRRQLLDIGAAGPLAGFVPSVIALLIGYGLSEVAPDPTSGVYLSFGDSLLTIGLQHLVLGPVPEGYTIFIHPVGFAGWVGLFVTMWNLFPFWQFDGGHITYALFGRRQWSFGPVAVAVIVGLGILVNPWWLIAPTFLAGIIVVWNVIIRLMTGVGLRVSPGEIFTSILSFRFLRHFPVPNEEPLDRTRRIIGWLCLLVFALCFIPDPIRAVSF